MTITIPLWILIPVVVLIVIMLLPMALLWLSENGPRWMR